MKPRSATAAASRKKSPENPALAQEFPARLSDLELEIRPYPSRPAVERALKSIEQLEKTTIGAEQVIQFRLEGKVYAAGHTDVTYSGSNHARGVRHIRFYSDGKTVFDIEGDYEDQQLGSNFRFQNIDVYLPGDWEQAFIKLTNELRHYKETRRNAFKKKRVAEMLKLNRRRTS